MEQHISIHAPLWDATWIATPTTSRGSFQSTRPCGTRPPKSSYKLLDRSFYFNPRAPVGRDNLKQDYTPTSLAFQSTRPCGTRQKRSFEKMSILNISIHAPLWDATVSSNPPRFPATISIHAPLWDATKHAPGLTLTVIPISIHAPLWDAT